MKISILKRDVVSLLLAPNCGQEISENRKMKLRILSNLDDPYCSPASTASAEYVFSTFKWTGLLCSPFGTPPNTNEFGVIVIRVQESCNLVR